MLLENLKIILSIIGTQTNAKDLVTPQADLVEKIEQSFSDGTGADQAQVIFSDTRTLAGSTNESLDLAGGLPHALGGTITFSAIKAIIVKARDTNTGNLRVGAGVANAFQGFFGASAIGNLVTPRRPAGADRPQRHRPGGHRGHRRSAAHRKPVGRLERL
jgi:hypothetical protein